VAGIEDYAIIGDLHTAALVSTEGSIDWLCLPRFDSSACFAALVGDKDNGRWRLAPAGAKRCTRRRYRPDTLILETDWETDTGSVRVTDFMPVRDQAADLVRIV
jgi:GH15 family glucan-1,4-alpha-glucosidase